MTKLTTTSVARNFPEFIREEYPLFVKLVEEYYKFLDTTYVGQIDSIKDIDNTPELFIEYFRKQYSVNVPSFWRMDFRDFLYFAKEFYSSRGSENSIQFLFRAMFGEEITIDYPGKYVLRASDGKWKQEFHIEVQSLLGTFPEIGLLIEFENSQGGYHISPSRVERIDGSNRCFVFFEQPFKLHIDEDQKYIQKNTSGEIIWVGRGLRTASYIEIENPGEAWQLGAVLRIPGTYKDTFARVLRTNSSGGIETVEILEYGYDHDENQSLITSPYPNRPVGSIVDINSEIIGVSPLAYHHTIGIQDFTDGCIETIKGTSTDQDFFMDLFFEQIPGFFGRTVISKTSTSPIPAVGEGDQITIDEWLRSRATLVFRNDNIVRERGFYTNSDSLISNKEIRLHDSFFYQAFSYVIETENDLRAYRDSIGLTHPAGMKFFALMTKEVSIDISALIETTFGTHQITFVDIQEIVENAINDFTKARFDQVTPSDVRPILHVDKNLNEYIDPEESLKKATIKLLNDTPEITEEQVFEFTKKLVDSSSMSDNRWSLFTKTNKETAAASETINKSTTKPFSDSISLATESSYSVALRDSFFAADYFADKYFTPTLILEIS